MASWLQDGCCTNGNYAFIPGKKKGKDKGQKFLCYLNQFIFVRKAVAFSGSHIGTYISNILLLISLWLNLCLIAIHCFQETWETLLLFFIWTHCFFKQTQSLFVDEHSCWNWFPLMGFPTRRLLEQKVL